VIIFNTAIDLKITPDNKVKILEFEASQHAGVEGYRAVTGKDMLEDVIYPWMESQFNVPVLRPDAEKFYSDEFFSEWFELVVDAEDNSQGIEDRFSPSMMKAIVVTPRYHLMSNNLCRMQLDGGHITPTVNANETFLQMTANKSFFEFILDVASVQKEDNANDEGHKLEDNETVGSLFPDAYTMPRDYDVESFDLFDEEMGQHSQFVIKLPNESQHKGVVLANRDNIYSVMHELSLREAEVPSGIEIPKEWAENFSPVMVVQERVKSKPVSFDGRDYDGTMRAFATVWFTEKLSEDKKTVSFEPHI